MASESWCAAPKTAYGVPIPCKNAPDGREKLSVAYNLSHLYALPLADRPSRPLAER